MNRRVRVAIAGFGFAGAVRHRLAYARDGRARVVAVLDPDPARRDEARRLGLRAVPDLDALRAIPADCWSVCSPPEDHLPLARAALEDGRHVLVEKPLTPEPRGCAELVELAARQGRVLAVGHNFLLSEAWCRLRRWQGAGRLGPIRSVQAIQWSGRGREVPGWTTSLRGGLLFDELPHHLYLMRDLLGELEVRQAWSDPRGPRLEAVLQSDRGTATLSAWMDAPRTEWWLVVAGVRGSVCVDLFRDAAIWLPGEPRRTYRSTLAGSTRAGLGLLRAGWDQAARRLRGRHLYGTDRLIRRFLDATETGAPVATLPSGADGAAAVKLLTRVLDAAGLGDPRGAPASGASRPAS